MSWAALAIGVGSAVGGYFGSKGKKGSGELEDLRSGEQKTAISVLNQLGTTGSYGGINLGEKYSNAIGSYDTSGQNIAYNQLMNLYQGEDLTKARDVYTQMADNKFNPDDPSSGYAAFSRALARAGNESSDVLNREAAMTGSRFGTGIQAQKADLAAQMQDQRGQFLAQLYNQGQNRALQGASGLQGLVGTKANLSQAMSTQAALANEIKNQQLLDQYNEFKRARSEDLARIDILSTEAGRNPYTGVSSIPQSNAMSSLSSTAGSLVGSLLSNYLSKGSSGSSNINFQQSSAQSAANNTGYWFSNYQK